MLVVIALGGNAMLQRGEPMTARAQRRNIRTAAEAIAEVMAAGHRVVITHGNGPQVGLLALQSEAYRSDAVFPLDVLGAESEGMIGYVLEQELGNVCGGVIELATLLTQVEVDPDDPAFRTPSKPIGPVYAQEDAERLKAERGWAIAPDGKGWRRVVASPRPQRVLEIGVIRKLIAMDVTVICAGGGGIPVSRRADGTMVGVEAVIDKDHASGLLARELGADAFLMLTEVDAVYCDWATPQSRPIPHIDARNWDGAGLDKGSIGPKVAAACEFATATQGLAGIGALKDAVRILRGETGTRVVA